MWIVILVIFILAAIVRLAFWITRNERNRDKPETTITTSTVLGISVRRETTTGGDQPDIKIILTSRILLPPPLAIGNDDVPAQDELRFDTDDFPAINRLIGREALDEGFTTDLRIIKYNTRRFHIFQNRIFCHITARARSDALVNEVTAAAARVATRLRELEKTIDLRLYVMLNTYARSRTLGERKNNLRLLLAYYNENEPLVRKTLEQLEASPEFELACLAAEGLGKEMTQFMFDQAEHASPASRIVAVREICARRLAGAFEFLTQLYHTTTLMELRQEIVRECRRLGDGRTSAFLAGELENVDDELLPAVIDSLAACGDREALTRLYPLSAEKSRPRHVRQLAGTAIACILRRVGHKEAGMLSNTAGGGDAGELSLTGEDDDEQKPGLQ